LAARPSWRSRASPCRSRARAGPATLLEEFAGFITVHPSYLLRIPEEDAKAEAYRSFVGDLRQVRELGEATRAAATLV
jgi:DNA polymerase